MSLLSLFRQGVQCFFSSTGFIYLCYHFGFLESVEWELVLILTVLSFARVWRSSDTPEV